MEILNEFGIKPILLIAQIVNFLILLFLLKKFLYRPILKVLDERKNKIAEGLANAEEIEKKLALTNEEREKKLQEASKESKKIIEEAVISANQIIENAHQKAKLDIEKMVAKAHEEINLERDQLHQQIRSELANFITLGMQKVAGKVLSIKDKESLMTDAIKEFES